MSVSQNSINSGSGTVINKVRTTSFSQTSTTSTFDASTTPTTSNTTLLTSLTIQPEDSSNVLVFNFCGQLYPNASNSSGGAPIICLFEGSTLLTSAWSQTPEVGSALGTSTALLYQQAAGTTSSTTYYIYYAYINYSNPSLLYSNFNVLGFDQSYTFTITEKIA